MNKLWIGFGVACLIATAAGAASFAIFQVATPGVPPGDLLVIDYQSNQVIDYQGNKIFAVP